MISLGTKYSHSNISNELIINLLIYRTTLLYKTPITDANPNGNGCRPALKLRKESEIQINCKKLLWFLFIVYFMD
jgi:hypothetical protein